MAFELDELLLTYIRGYKKLSENAMLLLLPPRFSTEQIDRSLDRLECCGEVGHAVERRYGIDVRVYSLR